MDVREFAGLGLHELQAPGTCPRTNKCRGFADGFAPAQSRTGYLLTLGLRFVFCSLLLWGFMFGSCLCVLCAFLKWKGILSPAAAKASETLPIPETERRL